MLIISTILLCLLVMSPSEAQHQQTSKPIQATQYPLGPFTLTQSNLLITVTSTDDPSRVLWQTLDTNTPFLFAGTCKVDRAPISTGSFQLKETTSKLTSNQDINPMMTALSASAVTFSGSLIDDKQVVLATYILTFQENSLSANQLNFTVVMQASANNPQQQINRLFMSYQCEKDETFHGFGEQYTDFTLKGKRIPFLVSEQGIGRGTEPVTTLLNTALPGSGGYWYTTYAPNPLYITSQNRSVIYYNTEVMYIDLTASERVGIEKWGLTLNGTIININSMKAAISEITLVTGRMRIPPAWSQQGAIVGLEGGTQNVSKIVELLQSKNVPIAGIWLQDWSGRVQTKLADRLLWNWEINKDWYPGWDEMVQGWSHNGIRVLTYLNPFFSNPANVYQNFTNNYYEQGVNNGYFVKNSSGQPYILGSAPMEFCMIDLTNPQALEWMKSIIQHSVIGNASSSGWMNDFGEYLPFDAVLFDGTLAEIYHNYYPQAWAKLTSDAVAEILKQDDIVYFMRSGWLQSPKYNSMFWMGDQLIDWDAHDGLRSTLLAAFSGGLVGYSFTHSDIGGYTVVDQLGPFFNYSRSPELLKRWTEFAAFGSSLFRTHIGSSVTGNAQVYDNDESIAHFSKFAGIFGNLSQYRLNLMNDSQGTGLPLMRHMALEYGGYDEKVWSLELQYMFGDDFLIAPCMEEGSEKVHVYIPPHSGIWLNLWSDQSIPDSDVGQNVELSTPIGFPGVLYQSGSVYGEQLKAFVNQNELGRDGFEQIVNVWKEQVILFEE